MQAPSNPQRRALRQRIRAVGGGLLLAAGCLAAGVTLLSSSPAGVHRQLTDDNVHIHVLVHKAAPWEEESVAANATTEAEAQAESCGVTADWERHGGILLYVFLLLYIFVALAIVCDDYFVTALERITEKLGLSQDVAGATFMAAGSSAPELFVSLADNVFQKPEGSMGIGTIVGSAIFNILIIISLSALLAGQVLVLDWRPMLRDSLWYCWAIVVLAFAIWDGSVDVFESVLLFGSYIAYCLFMSQNERVTNTCCKRPDDDELQLIQAKQEAVAEAQVQADRAAQLVDAHVKASSSLSLTTSDSERRAWTIDVERVEHSSPSAVKRQTSTGSPAQAHIAASGHHHHHPHRLGSQSKLNPMFRSKYRMFQNSHSMLQDQPSRRSSSSASSQLANFTESDVSVSNKHVVAGSLRPLDASTLAQAAAEATIKSVASLQEDPEQQQEEKEHLGPYFGELYTLPEGVLSKLWFLFTLPIVVPMRLTIPDCRYPIFSGTLGFTATFLIAIAWIAVLSHFTIVYATRFGCIAGIPSALMGLTILAAGTSIPDALSSILVARDGHGDMAVSNALGSNVFDILLGLGFPFFLSNLVYKEPVVISTDDLEMSIIILFAVLVTVVTLLILSKWRLRRAVGVVMIVLYAVYVVVSYLRGLDML